MLAVQIVAIRADTHRVGRPVLLLLLLRDSSHALHDNYRLHR